MEGGQVGTECFKVSIVYFLAESRMKNKLFALKKYIEKNSK